MPANENLWTCTPTDTGHLPGDVQVRAGWLDVTGDALSGFWPTLSHQEQERACRFLHERDRARFVVGRGMLRALLGSCLGAEPRRVEFGYSTTGKPSLSGPFARSGLQFNLAHSGGLAVFAVARCGVVGVDVEQIRLGPDFTGLSERFFSASECAEVEQLSGEDQARVFYTIWTRKEAWLKATGEGIAGLPKSVEVLGPPSELGLCGAPPDGSRGTRLCLHDLAPAPGFIGALAVSPH